jgi:MFS superfamily sulfate permease-like transporter
VHRSFGTTYGMIAATLVRRGWRPLPAGLAVGAVAFLLVDEGTALPLATSYPLVSHLRGVVGHATVGLTIGFLLSLLAPRQVSRRRP